MDNFGPERKLLISAKWKGYNGPNIVPRVSLLFPYRDNDMIFRILDLLSNSHEAMINGRVFEFEPIRIVITTNTL